MLLTISKDQPAVVISTSLKTQRHAHLESLENFYKIFSDSKGEELI